jgi:hypothetical protein
VTVPRRIKRQAGRYALVDGVPFHLPIDSDGAPALMAAFTVDAGKAQALLPGNELHILKLGRKGLLLITVVDYRKTDIGKYIEFSIALVCTRGRKPAPPLLPAVFRKWYGTGQYVFDLPVSTEISVKGGKGIWGMPKHQANLDFKVGERRISSQYDLDGRLAVYLEIEHPGRAWFPVRMAAANYCTFRGMLFKSSIYFQGRAAFSLFKKGSARLILGDHPRVQPLKRLEIGKDPIATAFIPEAKGLLDDYCESWFLPFEHLPMASPEGLESVVHLGLSEAWLAPPRAELRALEHQS